MLTGAVNDERVKRYKDEALVIAKDLVSELKKFENPKHIETLMRDFDNYMNEVKKIEEGRVK